MVLDKVNNMSNNKQRPIGVFDSGVGGLTNVRALMERLPMENIVYFGDTARVPYGVKSRATIETFTAQIVEFLLQNDVKALVIACNTIAAVAGQKVRAMAGNMPVLDVITAGAEAALATTRTNHISVMATSTTVNSNAYARAIHSRNPDVRVQSQACPLLVPLVEEGWLDHEVTRLTAREYLKPLLADDIDTLVLGCTHYVFIKDEIRQLLGPDVHIIDTGAPVARQTRRILDKRNALASEDAASGKEGTVRLYTTGGLPALQAAARRWMNLAPDYCSALPV